jgi:hypothetical protein
MWLSGLTSESSASDDFTEAGFCYIEAPSGAPASPDQHGQYRRLERAKQQASTTTYRQIWRKEPKVPCNHGQIVDSAQE